jgi:hypothetical protein
MCIVYVTNSVARTSTALERVNTVNVAGCELEVMYVWKLQEHILVIKRGSLESESQNRASDWNDLPEVVGGIWESSRKAVFSRSYEGGFWMRILIV